MKKLLFIFFISVGFLSSCVENPVEDPLPLPAPGNVKAIFDGQLFSSTSDQVSVAANAFFLKAAAEDGSYFKITLPEAPVLGTYNFSVFSPGAPTFSLAYFEGPGAIPFVAARDNVGEFAPFPTYVDTAELVIFGIDRVNQRIFGTFRFTGVRFTDATRTAVEVKVFTDGFFTDLPYVTTPIDDEDEDLILPRRIVNSYPGTTIADQTIDYTYIGTKIRTETYTDSEGNIDLTTYNYDGNNIESIENTVDGTLEYKETFAYDNNQKLTTYIALDYFKGTGVKETYVHNANGSISVTRFTGDLDTQTTEDGTSTINFTNGEVSSISFSSGVTFNYTYDNKNNAFKNVLGLGKISFVDGEAAGISRNGLTKTVSGSPIPEYSFSYTYDLNDYPITASATGILVTISYE